CVERCLKAQGPVYSRYTDRFDDAKAYHRSYRNVLLLFSAECKLRPLTQACAPSVIMQCDYAGRQLNIGRLAMSLTGKLTAIALTLLSTSALAQNTSTPPPGDKPNIL